VAFGLHPRASRPNARWHCAAGLGWCCPSTTWRLACTQEDADQAPGGAVFAQPQAGSSSVTCVQPRGRASSVALGAAASVNAPTNSAVHSAQYPRYSATQCSPQ